MTFRPLQHFTIARLEQNAGRPPRLDWLPLAKLGVDDDYQRTITAIGMKTISRIAANFRWARFSPLIVVRNGADRFAIIDGQHRATAALSQGFDKVPCYIVEVSPLEAAQVFAAVNGMVTPMSALALYKAALAGEEPWAMAIARSCQAAGITPLLYPVQRKLQKPCHTMALGTLRNEYLRRGEAHVTAALKLLMAFADMHLPGALNATAIQRVLKFFTDRPHYVERVDILIAHARGRNFGLSGDGEIEMLLARAIASTKVGNLTAEVRALDDRHYKPAQIAATLKLPYAEVNRILAGEGKA